MSDQPLATDNQQLTGLDIYECSKEIYAKLRKISQRALAHHIACDMAWKAYACGGGAAYIEVELAEIKKWESAARSERRLDSFERHEKEFEKLKANGWRKPRKKRRKKRTGVAL